MSSTDIRTRLTAMLNVRDWNAAMEFYKKAFGAIELYQVPGGGVGQLAIDGADFWVAEESVPNKNFSPDTLTGSTARMILVVQDPDAVFARALAAGATQVVPVKNDYGWRLGRLVDPSGHHWEIGHPL
jgi:PhnB protein